MNYEQGLARLKQQAKGTDWIGEFALYEARLRENLSIERRYGTTEQVRADRAQIVDQLNRLSLTYLHMSFVALCLGSNRHTPATPAESEPTIDQAVIGSGVSSSPSIQKLSPSHVFIGYSHQDKSYLEELRPHLIPYIRSGVITYWDETKILPGDQWRSRIEEALQAATTAVLLISADFLASDFIVKYELPMLMKAAQQERLTILCVIVRPCLFEDTALAQFQPVNAPSQPLSAMSRSKRDAVWMRVAELLKNRV
ncbi:MAG TPA: toll/interleukin-1 receptor domain-containing protein [Ktedonosporobacter sp.]|jgi:hypothetical protein|nr:toll/interleukin-1 receptor domain-containing protein [Ktedonosporobacter sp.]